MAYKKQDNSKEDVREEKKEEYHMTAGQQFVRAIGPVGCILFLLLFVLYLVFCFTGGLGI